jgi:hypothetical protein
MSAYVVFTRTKTIDQKELEKYWAGIKATMKPVSYANNYRRLAPIDVRNKMLLDVLQAALYEGISDTELLRSLSGQRHFFLFVIVCHLELQTPQLISLA